MLSETFWVSFVTIFAGLVASCLGVAYKSKCSEISCCGMSIKRNVNVEMKEDLYNMRKMNFTRTVSEEGANTP